MDMAAKHAEVGKLFESFVKSGSERSVAVRVFCGLDYVDSIHGDVVRPLASVIKLAITMAAYDLSHAGILDIEEAVPVGTLGTTRYNSLLAVFDKDHKFSLRELCSFMLATSDNVVSQYILGLVGHGRVNDFLDRSGCSNTILQVGYNDIALSPIGRRNTGTANDVMDLLAMVHANPRYTGLLTAMENGIAKNRIALRLPHDLKIGNKSGTLEGAVNDAGIIKSETLEIGIVVLADGEDDPALTALEIGEFAARLWCALGGRADPLH